MLGINFYVTDFQKTLKTNTRFMCNLERQIKVVKNLNKYIYVAMNVLSNHKLIKDIKNFEELYGLLKILLIDNNKFRLVVHIKESETKIYINCPFNDVSIYNEYYKIYNNSTLIKKISIEYFLAYDAASDEAKKKYK